MFLYQVLDKLIAVLFINSFHQRTPLHMAVEANHKQTVEYLVKEGAEINIQDKWGVSTIIIAVLFINNQ